MNTLDLIILAVAASAIVGGWRLGLLARATSWLGLALGLFVAARLLPSIARAFEGSDPTSRLLVVAGLLVAGAFLGQALGLLVGAQVHRVLPPGPLRMVDRSLGGVAGLLGVLVALWVMLPAMANVQGWPAQQARHSAIARAIDDVAPDPPDTLQALRRLVGDNQFAQVFKDDLAPSKQAGPPPAASPLPADVDARVRRATVKISGVACRRIQEGSGWAVAPGVVVTNAHVVAGQDRTEVLRPDGTRLNAVVTVFDPNRDLAILRVRGLDEEPLTMDKGEVGEVGAVFGHPGGQDPLRVAPAKISQEVLAVGRDLYDSRDTRRDVYILASDLHPGDSGGALVNRAGVVVGVAFAIAPDRPNTAYALTTAEVRPVLAANRNTRADTGPCLSDV